VEGVEAGEGEGRRIIQLSWATVALFAVIVIPDALGVDALDGVAVGVALGLFLVSLPIWLYAYGHAVNRTARGDDISVSGLFFLTNSAPKSVRRQLMGALVASLAVTVATAAANPFSVLVPMLPLGFAGLWGSRHGVYPPRKAPPQKTGGRR
jgi:hypothetical protein